MLENGLPSLREDVRRPSGTRSRNLVLTPTLPPDTGSGSGAEAERYLFLVFAGNATDAAMEISNTPATTPNVAAIGTRK